MLTELCVVFFSPFRAVLSAILRDEYLTSAVRTPSLVLTAEVKYSSSQYQPPEEDFKTGFKDKRRFF